MAHALSNRQPQRNLHAFTLTRERANALASHVQHLFMSKWSSYSEVAQRLGGTALAGKNSEMGCFTEAEMPDEAAAAAAAATQ